MSGQEANAPGTVVVPESPVGQELEPGLSASVGTGWATFAGILFLVAGLWNMFAGFAGLLRKEYFSEASMLYRNLRVAGWTWLIMGVIQVLTSYLIVNRRPSGRVLGITVAALSMLVWFFSVGAYPAWAVMVVALDALIIYGLAAHGEAFG